jgi:hypothetical protein
MIKDRYQAELSTHTEISPVLDRKFFWNKLLQVFQNPIFGLEFADPCGVWKIRRKTAEIFRDLSNSPRHGEKEHK